MKTIFRIAAISAVLLAGCASSLHASDTYRGQKSMGLYGGFSTRNESGLAGIGFTYRFARCFTLAPSVDYTFRHKGEDNFNIDLNAHIPISVSSGDRVNIYPLAGVGYTSVSIRNRDHLLRTTNDNRHRADRFGLNIGGGVEWMATTSLRLALEGKWRWRSDYSTAPFTLGISYMF